MGIAMTLIQFLDSLTTEEKKLFLNSLLRDDGTAYHPVAIRACATGRRRTSHKLALLIELNSGGLVPRWAMRPDIGEPPKKLAGNGKKRTTQRKPSSPA